MSFDRKTQSLKLSVCKRVSILFFVVLMGCETVVPLVKSLVLAFGQDLLATAAVNYTPRYAMQVEALLAALAHQGTGLNFQPQLQQAGYRPPPPKYMKPRQTQRPEQPQQNDPYSNQGDNQGSSQESSNEDPYGSTAANTDDDPYGNNTTDNPYGDASSAESENPYETEDPYNADPYEEDPYEEDPYATQNTAQDESNSDDPYGSTTENNPYALADASSTQQLRTRSALQLNATLLAQRAGSQSLEPIADGETLKDGNGDPRRGDKLKIHFQVNCRCFVYVIGIDATGYVAQIFPDPDSTIGNPVVADQTYMMPGGNEWWALDDYKGIEQIYFVASRQARSDIENTVAQLKRQPRQLSVASYQPVSEPAIIPTTRGMVKVAAEPIVVAANRAQTELPADGFLATNGVGDLTITRWFKHQ